MAAANLPYVVKKRDSHYVRLVVPKPLQPFADGEKEIYRSLGNSLREVKANHARALASAQDRMEEIKRRKADAESVEHIKATRRYAEMTPDQMARDHYRARIAFDDELRNDPRYAAREIDTDLVAIVRDIKAGRGTDEEIAEALGDALRGFRARGNTDAEPGSPKWRGLARTLASAEYEALSRAAERDDGDFTGKPQMPALLVDEPDPVQPITFTTIIDDEVKKRTAGKDAAGVRERTIKVFRRECAAFAEHRGSDDATTVTLAEGEAWIAHLLNEGKLSAKTIGNTLIDVRTVLNWGRSQRKDRFPPVNPLGEIEKPKGVSVPTDQRTYTMAEARTILRAAQNEKTPALHFVPWMLAYSGSRISEIANLQAGDFFQIGNDWFFKITTSGGRTTKTVSSIRRVPVHADLIKHGLIEHVKSVPAGERVFAKRSQILISQWLNHKLKLKREHLAPNHSWRHLFEDLCTVGGVLDDARAYMTGRATGTSRDRYGRSEAALPGLAREMAKVPSILDEATAIKENEK